MTSDHTENARLARMASLAYHGRQIGVAEDDPAMRAMVANALRNDGHDVIELRNGAELLIRIARQYHPDAPEEPLALIVSDVCMPVITGLAILRGLRDAGASTPVVLMTAFSDSVTRSEAESLDAIVLDKPFQLSRLRAEVRRLLAAHEAA